MKLRDEILKEHSKAQCIKIAKWVGNSQVKFDQLFSLFLHDEPTVVQRAGWPLSYIVIAHPHLLQKHWPAFVAYMQKAGLHNAVRRNSVRLLEEIDIPEEWQGTVMDTCFRFLEDPAEFVAVKACSLTVLANLAKLYPDIIPELTLIIESQLPHQTAAFKSRGRKVLAQLKKI